MVAAAASFILLAGILFPAQVQALAGQMYRMVMEVFDTHTSYHWMLEIESSEGLEILHSLYYEYFPSDWFLTHKTENVRGFRLEEYHNEAGEFFSLTQSTMSAGISIDSEGAEYTSHTVNNVTYEEYQKRGFIQILWQTGGNIFHVDSNMDPELVRKVALNIRFK